jgi:hypothetical protein
VDAAKKKMNAVLAEMTPDEMRNAPWFVTVFARSGRMTVLEADEWHRRIEAWNRYLCLDPGDAPVH